MKLSIITINFNHCDGFRKTAESVVCQTFKDYEWIVVDGGSSDGSKELIEQYASHIAWWCSEPDKGVYNAMNKGILHSSGDYICCMNSGDVFFESDTLYKVFSDSHSADILYGDWIRSSPDHNEILHAPSCLGIHSLYEANICHQAMFVKNDILQKKAFDETYQVLADYKRWVDAALSGTTFKYLDLIVCVFETGGLSDRHNSIAEEEQMRIKASYPEAVANTVRLLEDIKGEPYLIETHNIAKKGGISFLFLRAVLKVLSFQKNHCSRG